MPYRYIQFRENNVYHIFTKSISGYKIFELQNDAQRFLNTLLFYNTKKPELRFSEYNKKKNNKTLTINYDNRILKILAYCIMPTHFHLIIEPLISDSVSHYINVVLKSYSRYFNVKHNRKGPLWESRFRSVLLKTDEQLLHLTRYIHLNPVTAYLVHKPEDWEFSSYREYIGLSMNKICNFTDRLTINSKEYMEFVNERISYQRELAIIKHLIME